VNEVPMPEPGILAGRCWCIAGMVGVAVIICVCHLVFLQGALRRCVSEELAAGQAQAAAVEPQQQEQEQQQQGRHYEGQPAQRAPDLLTPGSSSSRSQISRGSGEGEPTQLVLDGAAFTLASSLVAGRPIDDPFTARLKQDPAVAQELQKVGGWGVGADMRNATHNTMQTAKNKLGSMGDMCTQRPSSYQSGVCTCHGMRQAAVKEAVPG
jgi:hypothetical protein